MNLGLSAEDRHTADEFFRELSASNHKRLSNLEEKVERWRELVAEIEAGYCLTIDDYWNDVDTRTILDLLLQELSPSGRTELSYVLLPTDEQFLAVTRMIAEPHRSEGQSRNWPWTWYRIPVVSVGELRQDVETKRL